MPRHPAISFERAFGSATGLAALASLALAGPAAPATQGSWPDYRGPGLDGRAERAAVPLEWSETRHVRWRTPVHGRGWSTPVVWDGEVWLTTATADGTRLSVLCLDVATGTVLHDEVLWTVTEPAKRNTLNSYASPSPVLFGDLLIFHVDGGDVQYVVALDKQTEDTVWKRDRSVDLSREPPDRRKAYGTPVIARVRGADQLIGSGAGATVAHAPLTGKELWTVHHPGFSMATRPVIGRDTVYVGTGFMQAELWAVRLGGRGDVTQSHVRWRHRRSVPTMASPVLVEDRLYFVNDGGIATCLDADTGETLWRERLGGEHCASPVFASGRVYFFDREGRTKVVKEGREFELLAENELDGGFMASPAIVGDAFVLRTETHVYRIEEE